MKNYPMPLEQRVVWLRGEYYLLDFDLAFFFRATNKRLNDRMQVNKQLFKPQEFIEITIEEKEVLLGRYARLKNFLVDDSLPFAFNSF